MPKNWKWYDIVIPIFTFLAVFWPKIADVAEKSISKTPGGDIGDLIFRILAKSGFWGAFIFGFLSVGITIFSKVSSGISRKKLKKYLDFVHKKYFPHSTGTVHPDFRVSLFFPKMVLRQWPLSFKKRLVMGCRSGDTHPRSKITWCIESSLRRKYDGVVGYAWATRIFVEIDDLPDYDRGTRSEKSTYRKKTFITEEKVRQLNMRARAYRCLIIQNFQGEKIAAIMLEALQDPAGLKTVTSDIMKEEASILQHVLAD